MEKLIIEKINEVYVRVLCEQGARMEISEYFSFYIPNRWFNPKVKRKMWDGKVRFFDSRGSILPIGLLPKLHTFAQEFKYDIEYNFDTSKFTKQMSEENYEKFISTIFEGTKFYPYEHQSDIIYSALTKKRGVISSPTASGKSLSIYSIVRYMVASNRKTILIVPSTMLVDQMYADFKDYGWQDLDDNVTLMYSGKVPDYSKNVLITTWQSMIKKDPYILKQYKALIVDEVHQGKALSIQTLCKELTNADYRIGLTGTLPKEPTEINVIHGYIGPTIYTGSSSDLIEKGILSKITIANMVLKYAPEVCEKMKGRNYHEEVKFVEEYSKRNSAFDFAFKSFKDGDNCLILVNHIAHLDSIEKYLRNTIDKKYTVYIISGNVDNKDREEMRIAMNKEKNIILLATYGTMATGISIKRIMNVILASSSKSKIRVLQTIGRGLRTHGEKDGVIIWDFIDNLNVETRNHTLKKNYLYTHWEERIQFYDEQGFKYVTKILDLDK